MGCKEGKGIRGRTQDRKHHRRKKKRVEQAELIVGGIGGKSEVRLQKERGFLRLRLG